MFNWLSAVGSRGGPPRASGPVRRVRAACARRWGRTAFPPADLLLSLSWETATRRSSSVCRLQIADYSLQILSTWGGAKLQITIADFSLQIPRTRKDLDTARLQNRLQIADCRLQIASWKHQNNPELYKFRISLYSLICTCREVKSVYSHLERPTGLHITPPSTPSEFETCKGNLPFVRLTILNRV